MSMDATVQVKMDSQLKAQVENLYHGLGTSFAEAVRIIYRNTQNICNTDQCWQTGFCIVMSKSL